MYIFTPCLHVCMYSFGHSFTCLFRYGCLWKWSPYPQWHFLIILICTLFIYLFCMCIYMSIFVFIIYLSTLSIHHFRDGLFNLFGYGYDGWWCPSTTRVQSLPNIKNTSQDHGLLGDLHNSTHIYTYLGPFI